uniref:Uncharacterized protein n=1 Tax=Pithovirus LCPAC403 TaxID=2506596 RepID=A0A481ZB50_9VIRU|nr:MAG: hypothetical protein LCPAC403_02920 [Pithovirus LCPAC403]
MKNVRRNLVIDQQEQFTLEESILKKNPIFVHISNANNNSVIHPLSKDTPKSIENQKDIHVIHARKNL